MMKNATNTVAIRRSGGARVVSLPKACLESLKLDVGEEVEISVEEGRIVLQPARQRLSLEELLEGCTPKTFTSSEEDRQWLNAPPVGREVI